MFFQNPARRAHRLLAVAAALFPVIGGLAAETNSTPQPDAGDRLREEMVERQLQKESFKSWLGGRDSLQGLLPPPAQPSLSPAQARRLKNLLEERRLWMFSGPDDANKKTDAENPFQHSENSDGGIEKNTPRVLKNYFSRVAAERMGVTNSTVTGARDDASGMTDDWLHPGGAGAAKSASPDTRSVFDHSGAGTGDSAIARLFQSGGGDAPAMPEKGVFSQIFSAPESLPQQRMFGSEHSQAFRDLLDSSSSPAARPTASALDSLPGASPEIPGGIFGGSLPAVAPPAPTSVFGSSAGGSGLLGASSQPSLASPNLGSPLQQFQPITIPRRKF